MLGCLWMVTGSEEADGMWQVKGQQGPGKYPAELGRWIAGCMVRRARSEADCQIQAWAAGKRVRIQTEVSNTGAGK